MRPPPVVVLSSLPSSCSAGHRMSSSSERTWSADMSKPAVPQFELELSIPAGSTTSTLAAQPASGSAAERTVATAASCSTGHGGAEEGRDEGRPPAVDADRGPLPTSSAAAAAGDCCGVCVGACDGCAACCCCWKACCCWRARCW
eukprot:scaffold11830_cov48-Phaeocystis_antarctica.AAC.2